MRVDKKFSFNGGEEYVSTHFPSELREVMRVIGAVDAALHKNKVSKEKTMPGRVLFNPRQLNKAFKTSFEEREWSTTRVKCQDVVLDNNVHVPLPSGAFREMDFVKHRLGVEVQLGKYAFMVYNVCAKMTIFHNLDVIDAGIEIVPMKSLADEMSTGVSYFEQIVWDLTHRGVSDIDIPVLVLGISD
ncbi:MAG: Restriction endonuclease BglII [Chloroflexi bacterium ADurb.Bin360]|nr:MAG: Restriction endonuclease BglII [Chloroflexi bacterium ADurb.Bin360]